MGANESGCGNTISEATVAVRPLYDIGFNDFFQAPSTSRSRRKNLRDKLSFQIRCALSAGVTPDEERERRLRKTAKKPMEILRRQASRRGAMIAGDWGG